MNTCTFMTCHPNGRITLIVRLETTDGGAYGEDRFTLEPGESLGQYSYEQLRARGSGYIDIDFTARPECNRPETPVNVISSAS